jgi:CRP-like cAMP-binding protein
VKGSCGFVLIRFENEIYKLVKQGETFGHIELAGDKKFVAEDSNFMRRSQTTVDLIRRFTVQAFESIDLLVIPISDLLKMKLEFPKYFNELFKNSMEKLRKDLI